MSHVCWEKVPWKFPAKDISTFKFLSLLRNAGRFFQDFIKRLRLVTNSAAKSFLVTLVLDLARIAAPISGYSLKSAPTFLPAALTAAIPSRWRVLFRLKIESPDRN